MITAEDAATFERCMAVGGFAVFPADTVYGLACDPDAKETVLELAAAVVTGRALDAGPLASSRALEGMTAVIVNLNKRYRAHAGVRITGLP